MKQTRTFNVWVVIEDELDYLTKRSLYEQAWLRGGLECETAIVFNAPRPLFGDVHELVQAPRGWFVSILHLDDNPRALELVWENHRQDATILKMVTVAKAREMADSERPSGYDKFPETWEKVWREAFYDNFRHATVEVECEPRY